MNLSTAIITTHIRFPRNVATHLNRWGTSRKCNGMCMCVTPLQLQMAGECRYLLTPTHTDLSSKAELERSAAHKRNDIGWLGAQVVKALGDQTCCILKHIALDLEAAPHTVLECSKT